MAKHVHKWVAQMGPGPSHGCEGCTAGKNIRAKHTALKKKTAGFKYDN